MIEKINKIFRNCLFDKTEEVTDPLMVEGITINVGFNKKKIEDHREEIIDLVDNLHPTFKEGWSFLNMCLNKDNIQWTGSHQTMQELLLLGLAIEKIEYLLPKEMWSILPGEMPYIKIREY